MAAGVCDVLRAHIIYIYIYILMHAIAYGGCMDTVRESALEADCGRKIPSRTLATRNGQHQLETTVARTVAFLKTR